MLDQLKEEVDKVNKGENGAEEDSPSKHDEKPSAYPNPTTKNFEFEVLHTITCARWEENHDGYVFST